MSLNKKNCLFLSPLRHDLNNVPSLMNIRPGTSSIYTNASSLLASAAAECLTSPPVNRFCISVIFSTLNLDCASVVSDYKTCSHSLSHQHTHWLTSESRLRSEDTAVDLRLNKLAISDRNHAYTSNTPTMIGFSSACSNAMRILYRKYWVHLT